MLSLEETDEKSNENSTLLGFEKTILSLETEIPLSEEEILLSSERTTLLLDLKSTLIHKIEDNLAIILLSGVIIRLDPQMRSFLLPLRMGPSSSELRRDSRSVYLRLLSQVAWRFTVWFSLEMIQKRVLKIRYERSSILMKSHLDVSVPVIMVLDFESGLRLVRRLIVNRSVEGRERH